MLRQILRFQFASRQSSKSVVTRFFSNKSTKSATKSIRKNSKTGAIFPPTPHSSTFSLAPLGTYAFKNYSTSNNRDNTESFEDLMTLLNTSLQQRDFDKALECATKALEVSKTSQQFQDALKWKLPLQFYSNKPTWDDDFLATVQKLDPNSADFTESWERLVGTLVTLKSYDIRSKTFFEKAFKVFPNNFVVTMKKAEVLFHYGLVDEVEPLLMKAIKIDSNRCRPWVLLWKLYPTHEEYLKKALECPDSVKEIYLWCEYATKQILQDGDFEAGMESLKKAIAIYRPILPAVDNTLSYIATQLHTVKKDSKSAEKVVRLWLEECPNNGTAWSALGTIINAQNNHQEAAQCYRKAIELDPSLAMAWFNLGNMVAPKEGIPLLLQAIQLQPDLHAAHYRLAVNYCELQQYEKALESVNKALKLKKHSLYLTLKASICGLLKQYKEEFLTAREILSANAQDPQCACVIFQMEERYEEGLAYIREKLNHDPKNHPFLSTEATFLNKLKRYDEALKVVDQAIQIAREKNDQPEYYIAMHYKAIILARSGNIIEAKQLAEFVQQQYDPATGIYPLGIVYLKEGNFDKALEMFEFNANFKGFETVRYTYFMDIAAVYEAKGDMVSAEKYLNLVLEINPNAKSAAEKLKEITKKKNL